MKEIIKPKSIIFLIMCLFTSLFFGCGSDNDSENEPDVPGETNTTGMIPYSVLPGTWIVESISYRGSVVNIDREITILPFNIKQTSDNIVDSSGQQFWAELYDPFTSTETSYGTSEETGLLGFYKEKTAPLSSALVYEFTLTIPDYDEEYKSIILVLTDLYYSSNTITSRSTAYNGTGITPNTELGVLTMKRK